MSTAALGSHRYKDTSFLSSLKGIGTLPSGKGSTKNNFRRRTIHKLSQNQAGPKEPQALPQPQQWMGGI